MDESTCCPEAYAKTPDRHFRGWLLDSPLRRLFFPPSKFIEGKVVSGMIVADLGSGPGYLSIPLAEAIGPKGRVFAVDSDERAIAKIRRKAEARGLTNLESRVSSAAAVDFIPDGSVDVLFGKGLLCCMADHAGVLREIKRLLRPDGLAYLSVRKGGSRTDPRRVGENEWDQILSNFFVDQRGDGWTNRWAWVRSNSETCPKRVQ